MPIGSNPIKHPYLYCHLLHPGPMVRCWWELEGLISLSLFFAAFSISRWHLLGRRIAAIIVLLLGGFTVRFASAHRLPYLNYWDERIHAIVAKNMISSSLRPCLCKRLALPYDYRHWAANEVWVHKTATLSENFFKTYPWVKRIKARGYILIYLWSRPLLSLAQVVRMIYT